MKRLLCPSNSVPAAFRAGFASLAAMALGVVAFMMPRLPFLSVFALFLVGAVGGAWGLGLARRSKGISGVRNRMSRILAVGGLVGNIALLTCASVGAFFAASLGASMP